MEPLRRIASHELFVAMAAGTAGGVLAVAVLSPVLVVVFAMLSFAARVGVLAAQALF